MTKNILLRIGLTLLMATTAAAFEGREKKTELGSSTSAQVPNESSGEVLAQLRGYRTQLPPPALQRRNPRYQVQAGDVLVLDFTFTPEFNDTVAVQPDGYISLRGLGDIHVEGQTVPELNQSLRAEYGKILHDPVITVSLKDFVQPYFIAFGEVAKPGKYDLRGDTTVTQGLAIAGGYTDKAKHSQVLLFRRVSNDWVETKELNVKRMVRPHTLREDLHLQPGDMLFVPKNRISKIEPVLPYSWMVLFASR